MLNPRFIALCGLLTLAACATLPAADNSLEQDFQRFVQWFEGEYDNHEQVWQQRQDKAEVLKEHIHHIFKAVDTPAIGPHTFFVKQTIPTDSNRVYRQRLYQLSKDEQRQAIALKIYRFKDEAAYQNADSNSEILKALTLDELVSIPGCDVYWTFADNAYTGQMDKASCYYFSKNLDKTIYVTDSLKLTKDTIWINDSAVDENGEAVYGDKDGVAHRNRKVSYYTGWGGFEKQRIDPTAKKDEWVFMQGIRIHNEGQRLPLLDKDGSESGVEIQLAKLTYQNTKVPILVLKFFKTGEEQSFAYSWAESNSARVGINMRWIQAGLTRE
ncbi:chromophore lyase CpcT/CpeT [Oceanicoccus sagamiensis]|uniref:Lipoprotein n=1 Tax=Oceanicoccus sagamiensis TaxID=716816 RepID=A0A1X9NH98_9GAMM|nr:chromophore lyase CpcT/CpeT [Oceanicoccus sagamiensis]ARN73353.1 hypothetical protein BST96_04055 [Oceanicoccus sagamiensis]